jgi:hypothetical protein
MKLYNLLFLNEGKGISNINDFIERLKKYYNQDNVYIHFSTLKKLGINPRNDHETPHRVYGYPFKKGKIDVFANERPYIIVFKTKKS